MVYTYKHHHITDGELLDAETPWLIQGLLAERWFALMCGLPGTGKSYLALDLALALAHGGSFLGRKVSAPARVSYVAMERAAEMRPRLRAYYRGNLQEHAALFSWTSDPVHLHKPASVEAYAASLHPETKLVVLDGVAHAMAGLDPMSDSDVARVVSGIELLRAKGVAVLGLHHTPRAEPRQERGSIMWRAYADVVVSVIRLRTSRQYRIEKANTGDEGASHEFVIRNVGDRGVVAPWIDADARILAAVPVDRGITPSEVVKALTPDIPQSTVYRRINDLAAEGQLLKDGRTYRRAA